MICKDKLSKMLLEFRVKYIAVEEKYHSSSHSNVRNNPTLIHPIPLLEIFSFFLICYYTIKTIDDWDWGISNDCWKLV